MNRESGKDWPFEDAPNTGVFTTRQVLRDGRPILQVSHDADADWQFLDRSGPDESDARTVGLAEIVEMDASIRELFDLPLGWQAVRLSVRDAWTRFPPDRLPADEE